MHGRLTQAGIVSEQNKKQKHAVQSNVELFLLRVSLYCRVLGLEFHGTR